MPTGYQKCCIVAVCVCVAHHWGQGVVSRSILCGGKFSGFTEAHKKKSKRSAKMNLPPKIYIYIFFFKRASFESGVEWAVSRSSGEKCRSETMTLPQTQRVWEKREKGTWNVVVTNTLRAQRTCMSWDMHQTHQQSWWGGKHTSLFSFTKIQ